MKTYTGRIVENTYLNGQVLRMKLVSDIAPLVQCGQFVQVQVPGFFLRRPISVCAADEACITLVYKVVGDGTAAMAAMQEGEELDLLGPLGNGFPLLDTDVILVGGGVGVPPLLETAKRYIRNGRQVTCVLGFNTKEDVILADDFVKLGCMVQIAAMDGSIGTKGTVMDVIKQMKIDDQPVLACGPLPMLKAIAGYTDNGYLSLESRMACGFGACMGCVVKTPSGESLRVCKDGPVFAIGEVEL